MKRPDYRKLLSAFLLLWICAASSATAQINPFGRLGNPFTGIDSQLLHQQLDKLLATGKVGEVGSWKNEKSGNHGTMELERILVKKNLPCRQVAHVIKLRSERDTRQYRLVYCKIGSAWKIAP